MTDKILIVDDDPSILRMLCKVAESIGFGCDASDNGMDALNKLSFQKYELMLLDINMSDVDGFTIIKKLRSSGNKIPIIIVSGRKEDSDTIYGLELGADDYVTKPFNPATLGAKIKALVRRNSELSGRTSTVITAGPFNYNTATLRFYKNGTEIPLTGKENALMKLFMDNVGNVFSKDTIYQLVWGDNLVDDNAVMVYINRLRSKIEDIPSEPKHILNVRGIGYRFIV